MIDISKGRYWDMPWSLVESCTRCSPGCDHCWALAIEKRFKKVYEGQVLEHPERLSVPEKSRKPTVYAVWNDLFHEAVPVNFLEDALATITNCPQHTFLILTKRTQRLNLMTQDRLRVSRTDTWPIKNLWLGITVCNQQEANEKIPVFLRVPGKKFLSIEPMLGVVDIRPYLGCTGMPDCIYCETGNRVHAVILGGETGPGARPMHPDWVRSIRGQCFSAGVPFFFKSWGKHIPELHDVFGDRRGVPAIAAFDRSLHHRMIDGRTHNDLPWVKP
jgi:protein gp37